MENKSFEFTQVPSDWKLVYNINKFKMPGMEERKKEEKEPEILTGKYYVPELEDIRVGYECEHNYMTLGEYVMMVGEEITKIPGEPVKMWEKVVCGEDPWNNMQHTSLLLALKDNRIRTPYLTKEQIESKGWIAKEVTRFGSNLPHTFYEKGNYVAVFTKDNRLVIMLMDVTLDEYTCGTSNGQIYLGECPSINEFTYITNKLLKIK